MRGEALTGLADLAAVLAAPFAAALAIAIVLPGIVRLSNYCTMCEPRYVRAPAKTRSCPGRGAARAQQSGAPLIRDHCDGGVRKGPGSAAHHCVLRCARDT